MRKSLQAAPHAPVSPRQPCSAPAPRNAQGPRRSGARPPPLRPAAPPSPPSRAPPLCPRLRMSLIRRTDMRTCSIGASPAPSPLKKGLPAPFLRPNSSMLVRTSQGFPGRPHHTCRRVCAAAAAASGGLLAGRLPVCLFGVLPQRPGQVGLRLACTRARLRPDLVEDALLRGQADRLLLLRCSPQDACMPHVRRCHVFDRHACKHAGCLRAPLL